MKNIGLFNVLFALGVNGMLPKLDELSRLINNASIESLILTYKLIQEKKSKLNRKGRDLVVAKVKYFIKKGVISESLEIIKK